MIEKLSVCIAIVSTALMVGCSGTLPEPLYANQVDAHFPEAADDAPEEARETRLAAERCAARLNGYRSAAETGSIVQSVISGFGGLTSGVGGVFSAIDFNDQDITTIMGVISAVGAGITLIGNLVLGLTANPVEEMRRHSQGLRSWDVAVELRYGAGDPAIIRQTLTRCADGEAPPQRVEGTGPAFSL